VQRSLQFLAGSEVVALQNVFDPAIEALQHAVCLRRFWRGQAVLDVQVGVEPVELVRARRSTLARAEEAIGELFSLARREGPVQRS